MEPVTTAILAAIAAGAAGGATEAGKQTIVDAYHGLKALLKRTVGADSDLVEAINHLEHKPASEGRKATFREEAEAAKLDQQPAVVQAAQALLDQLKAYPGGEQHIQTAIGHHIAQADRGGHATVITRGDLG
jgi:hypothetical protein